MRNIFKGFLILLSVIGLIVIIMVDNRDSLASGQKTLYFSIKDETIDTWEKDGTYYLFLPSYAELADMHLTNYSDKFTITDRGELIKHKTSLANLPINKEINCTFKKDGTSFVLYIMKSENLPSVFITTDSGGLTNILADKNNKENGKISVKTVEGETDYNTGLDFIKGRGNYSWNNYKKKPFTISIKTEHSLLGLPVGKDYVLVANASDPTLIRNDIVKGMEEELGVLHTGRGQFVDLYINGEYQGNYYLCDQIEIGPQRIAITNLEEQMNQIYNKYDYNSFATYKTGNKKAKVLDVLPSDITGGYLIEREFGDRYHLEYEETPSSFVTNHSEHFIVKSPGFCSVEQIDYISGYCNEVEEAILAEDGINSATGKKYTEYIDIESFVKKYLTEEVSKNYDAGVSSSFFYKDSDTINGHIFAGPGWDFDMTFGNYLEWMEYFSSDPEGISKLSVHDFSTNWFDALYEKEEFYDLIIDYYEDRVAPYLMKQSTEEINYYKEMLNKSADMDYIRWQEEYESNPYFTDRETSFKELTDFIEKRKQFLDSVWIDDQEHHIVKFMKDDFVYEVRYIEDGKAIGELPVVQDVSDSIWCEEITGQQTTENLLIKEETVFVYKQP